MIQRTPTFGYSFNGIMRDGMVAARECVYAVQTDEPYRVQRGDRTIEVNGDVDLVFDDVREEGTSFWVVRHGKMYGYTYSHGKWHELT